MGQGKVKSIEVLLFICTIRFIVCPWKSRRSLCYCGLRRLSAFCQLVTHGWFISELSKKNKHTIKSVNRWSLRVKYCIEALQILFSSPHLWMSKSSLDLSNYSVHSLLCALVLRLLKHQSLHLFSYVLNNWQSACFQSSVTLGKWVWRKFNLCEIIRRCLSSFLWFEISSPEVVLKWPDI